MKCSQMTALLIFPIHYVYEWEEGTVNVLSSLQTIIIELPDNVTSRTVPGPVLLFRRRILGDGYCFKLSTTMSAIMREIIKKYTT